MCTINYKGDLTTICIPEHHVIQTNYQVICRVGPAGEEVVGLQLFCFTDNEMLPWPGSCFQSELDR